MVRQEGTTNVSRPCTDLYTYTLIIHQVHLCAKYRLSILIYLYWKGQHVVVSCKPVRQADCRLRFLLTVLDEQPAASVLKSGCRKAHSVLPELAHAVAAGDEPAGY